MPSEHEIEEMAYYIWVSEGKPDGKSDLHWKKATRLVEEQYRTASSKRSTDPSEATGSTEPEQPDQT